MTCEYSRGYLKLSVDVVTLVYQNSNGAPHDS